MASYCLCLLRSSLCSFLSGNFYSIDFKELGEVIEVCDPSILVVVCLATGGICCSGYLVKYYCGDFGSATNYEGWSRIRSVTPSPGV